MEQTTLNFYAPPLLPSGRTLRDQGIQRALNHANQAKKNWQEMAFRFLVEYARQHDEFSGEEVREASRGSVPEPPSLRAWGWPLIRAAKEGIIEQIGYVQVKNPAAHRANAALWRSKINHA